METTNIAPAQSAQGFTHPSVGSSPKSLPTVSWKAVAMPRAGDYENISSLAMIVHPGTQDSLRQEDHKFELSLVIHNKTPSQKRQKLGQIKGDPIDGIDGFHHQCISLLLTLGNLCGKTKKN